MSKRRRRSTSEKIFWILSLVIALSMVISLLIVALPEPPTPTATPWIPQTPVAEPTATPTPPPPRPSPSLEVTKAPVEPSPTVPSSTPSPTIASPTPSLTVPTTPPPPTATEPPVGPVLPTATAEVTPTSTLTPESALEFTFAVCGDSRDNPSVYRRLLEAVMADGSEFLIHLGDLVNVGTEAEWQNFQDTMAGFTLPFYPVAGNHDGLQGKLDGFLQYSGAPAAHYSFDRGAVHFSLADSHNGGISASELAWLREDLGRTTQPVKMVFLHHPPFDPDGTDHIMAYGNEKFMELMVEQGVDYVFAGHIHAYAQQERDGVVYLITGGAGAPLYRTGHPQAFYHYLRVTVRGEEVTITVVRL